MGLLGEGVLGSNGTGGGGGGGGGISNVVEDLTPQLGGNLDVQASSIVSSIGSVVIDSSTVAASDIDLIPHSTGDVITHGDLLNKTGQFNIQAATNLVLRADGLNNVVTINTTAIRCHQDLIANSAAGQDIGTQALPFKDLVFRLSASLTQTVNGNLNIEAPSNTTLTFKLKGSDSTVRSGTITLS